MVVRDQWKSISKEDMGTADIFIRKEDDFVLYKVSMNGEKMNTKAVFITSKTFQFGCINFDFVLSGFEMNYRFPLFFDSEIWRRNQLELVLAKAQAQRPRSNFGPVVKKAWGPKKPGRSVFTDKSGLGLEFADNSYFYVGSSFAI